MSGDLDDLIGAWLDGVADAAAIGRLDALVAADPIAAARLVRAARLHADLRATAGARASSARRAIALAAAPRRRRRVVGAAILACAAAVAVALLLRPGDGPTLTESSGATLADGRALLAGARLRPGDRLRVGDAGAARLAWRDGTVLGLDPGVELALKGGPAKRVALTRGRLTASVARQPAGAPLVIATPTAEAIVVGTRFVVEARDEATTLCVAEGIVRLRGARGEIDVAAGGAAVVRRDAAPSVVAGDGASRVLRYADRRALAWAGDPAGRAWMRDRLAALVAYSPFFDAAAAAHPGVLLVRQPWALPEDDPALDQHPAWSVRDRAGRPVYVVAPHDGEPGLRAIDPAAAGWLASWLGTTRAMLAHGYAGLWLDHVELGAGLVDAAGAPAAVDAAPLRAADVAFLEAVRAALPGATIAQDTVWFADRAGVDATRAARAADLVHFARGVADPGLRGGEGEWSLSAFLAAVDRVHAAGAAAALEIRGGDDAALTYARAGALLVARAGDLVGDGAVAPDAWWRGYDLDLGGALGPRRREDGLWRREFSGGLVLLLEPAAAPRAIAVPAGFVQPDGTPARQVRLGPMSAAILVRAPP